MGSLGEGAGGGITMQGDGVWILEAVGLDFTDVHEKDLLAAGTCLPDSKVTLGMIKGSNLAKG